MTRSTLTRFAATLTLSSTLVLMAAGADARGFGGGGSFNHGGFAPIVRDHRGPTGVSGAPGGVKVVNTGPIVRDHRTPAVVRDHRSPDVVVRDHRGENPVYTPPKYDPRSPTWGRPKSGAGSRPGDHAMACAAIGGCPVIRDHR